MTAGESRVMIHSKWTAVSSSPVRPGKTYPLSVLDHAMAKHTVHMVFYYRARSNLDRNRLIEALSDVLSHYPAVTGRLFRDEGGKFVIRCNDAGVRMLDAKVEVTLDEWFKSASAEDERRLAYWEPMGEDPSIWSPFYIQITEFADEAFAIGLSLPHMHADPTCASLFIKAWGDSYRRNYIINPPFFHPPGLLPRSEPNISSRTADFLAQKSLAISSASATTARRRMLSATFRFSEEAVKSCFSHMQGACPDATPFDVLAALFWLSITTAAGAKVEHAAVTLCVDFRKSMHAPLPHGFYGNALHFSKVEADLTSGWEHTVGVINRNVVGLEEEEYWSGIEWLDSFHVESKPFQMYGPELTCIKMDHLLAYSAVFEKDGGKPVHVACRLGGVEGEGVVIVMPTAEEGMTRTVSVTLPAGVMDKVCKDEDILRHGPVVMFRG